MSRRPERGVSLVELLVGMAVAALLGSMVLPFFLSFQSRGLAEIGRNDLQDRAERLLRFMADDIREAAFLNGPRPRQGDGSVLALVQESLPGDPLQPFPFALLVDNGGLHADDTLTLVKAISFTPLLRLLNPAAAGDAALVLNRIPNRAPASSRELLPPPAAISHVLPANQPHCYAVLEAGQTTLLEQPLAHDVPAGTELLGVRAYRYQLEPLAGSGRLRRDDFTSREILDNAVDGLQFEYLTAEGQLLDQPDPAIIRGVRISLLVRALHPDPTYRDRRSYRLGDRVYGPYADHYRRILVSQLVEVKNYGG